jgi:hypothetical protein
MHREEMRKNAKNGMKEKQRTAQERVLTGLAMVIDLDHRQLQEKRKNCNMNALRERRSIASV